MMTSAFYIVVFLTLLQQTAIDIVRTCVYQLLSVCNWFHSVATKDVSKWGHVEACFGLQKVWGSKWVLLISERAIASSVLPSLIPLVCKSYSELADLC